jgi:hypothetical protein
MLSLSEEVCVLSVVLSSAVITDVEIDQMHAPVLSRYFLNKERRNLHVQLRVQGIHGDFVGCRNNALQQFQVQMR